MEKRKRNLIISGVLISLAILFTILVKVVDVQAIGPKNSSVGFASINQFFADATGVNMTWYHITDWLGIIALLIAFIYALIGLLQLIKRKSILKIDREIIILGVYYVVVIGLYVLFEKFIVNYRPVLMDKVLEASYPSSHTLMTLCICGSSIILNKKLYNNSLTKVTNILVALIMTATVIGRLISGVHWFTDIVGGILISSALLMIFYSILCSIKNDRKEEQN